MLLCHRAASINLSVGFKSGAGRPTGALSEAPGKHDGVALCPRRAAEKTSSVDYLRVLIIDDSLTIRAMLEELVEREEGCRVVGMASSANAARAMMIDLIPTVVTLDLNMPGVEGLTFLDELSGTVHAPIVVVSSATSAGSPHAAEAIKRGAYACFDKANILSEATSFVRLLKAAAKAGRAKSELT
jgi:two-component system chemotaxis response regulator CheB